MHGHDMDSSNAQSHHQEEEIGSETLESMVACRKSEQEKKASDMQSLKCPRCDSANTKFCYYNNYSLSQPRYFCKSCRRYWTKGGTLRNVPVGGGCRKNKRSSSSSRHAHPAPTSHVPPFSSYESGDLSLAIARLQRQPSSGSGLDDRAWPGPNPAGYDGSFASGSGLGLFDAIRSGFLESPVQSLYYGSMGNVEMGMGMGMGGEIGIPFDDYSGGGGGGSGSTASTAVTTVKQEMCGGGGGGREGEGRVLWGYPWQGGGGGGGDGNQAAGFDSGRGSWNGIGPSGWHGLLNSPLM